MSNFMTLTRLQILMVSLLFTGGAHALTQKAESQISNSCLAPAGYTKILTAQDLALIRANPNGNFFVCNDLPLNLKSFTPIAGESGRPFSGIFDGNGRIISFLSVRVANETNYGFFEEIGPTGVVRNITFASPKIEGIPGILSLNRVGVVAGTNAGRVENVSVSGSGLISYHSDSLDTVWKITHPDGSDFPRLSWE